MLNTEAQTRMEKAEREEVNAWKEKLVSDSSSPDALRSIASGTDGGDNSDRQNAAMELLEDKDPDWQSSYEQLEPTQLFEELKMMANSNIPSKYIFKVLLDALAKKGQLDWSNESLWIILNKLQKGTHFTPEDETLKQDTDLLHQKIQSALGEIYDFDEFIRLENLNEAGSTRGEIKDVTK